MAAFETGKYRNLLLEAGYDEQEIKNRLDDMFNTMFYGPDDERIYFPVGDDMGYITDTGNNDVRTEGMSYGMMICVQLDKKKEFDRIWKWTYTNMYLESGRNAGYFCWSNSLDGSKNANGPAPDGEEFFIMALFFASARWGDGEGIYEYSKFARELLDRVVHSDRPMFEPSNHYIKFICESDWTDPSYHLPHFYEMYACFAGDTDKALWKETAKASREYLKKACDPDTGMCAEYAEYDGSPARRPWVLKAFGGRHDWFYSDAYRTAANMGLDYEWFGADPFEVDITRKLREFYKDKCITENGEPTFDVYEIDGTRIDQKALHPYAIIATNAASVLATNEGKLDEADLNAIKLFWDLPLRKGVRRYYDNFLQIFAMMALSGNYRIYR